MYCKPRAYSWKRDRAHVYDILFLPRVSIWVQLTLFCSGVVQVEDSTVMVSRGASSVTSARIFFGESFLVSLFACRLVLERVPVSSGVEEPWRSTVFSISISSWHSHVTGSQDRIRYSHGELSLDLAS